MTTSMTMTQTTRLNNEQMNVLFSAYFQYPFYAE